MKKTNKILEDHGNWLLIDISTPKHPAATMAVDSDVWNQREGGRVYAQTFKTSKYIYAAYWTSARMELFHNLVLPKRGGFDTDHIKHGSMNYVDNRHSNLAYATRSENLMNRAVFSNSKSGITGVHWNSGKWRAQIQINGKNKHLGYFDNIDIAIGARQQAEREYFGEYAFGANN